MRTTDRVHACGEGGRARETSAAWAVGARHKQQPKKVLRADNGVVEEDKRPGTGARVPVRPVLERTRRKRRRQTTMREKQARVPSSIFEVAVAGPLEGGKQASSFAPPGETPD